MKYKDYDKYEEYMDNEEYSDEVVSENDEDFCDCDREHETKKVYPKKKWIEVDEVIGTGSAETDVEICIPLRPPAFEVMEELITKEVIFDALVASCGKVFINGRVIKDIPYKTRVKKMIPGCDNVTKLTFGDIRHVTAEIPFALCIDVPEAFKGAKVVVLDYKVNSVEIPNHTNCIPDRCIAKCEPKALKFDTCNRRPFCSLTEKDCIWVKVKVVKDCIISVPHFEYDK